MTNSPANKWELLVLLDDLESAIRALPDNGVNWVSEETLKQARQIAYPPPKDLLELLRLLVDLGPKTVGNTDRWYPVPGHLLWELARMLSIPEERSKEDIDGQ